MDSKGRWEWNWCFSESSEVPGYPAPEEWYSPFAGKNCLSLHAPYAEYPGGFLFKSAYFNISEGISDGAYIVTLERLLAEAQNKPEKAKSVAEARAFLDSLKKAIPLFPSIANMSSADAGALVGSGFSGSAAENCEAWRRKVAEYIVALNN
jgi:hypothetical protein